MVLLVIVIIRMIFRKIRWIWWLGGLDCGGDGGGGFGVGVFGLEVRLRF